MAVNRKELLTILGKVAPGLSNTEILEQSSSFIFMDGLVITFNDEISVSHPIPYDWTGAVVAKELMTLLKKYKDDEIEVNITQEEFLIKTKRGEAGIRLDEQGGQLYLSSAGAGFISQLRVERSTWAMVSPKRSSCMAGLLD